MRKRCALLVAALLMAACSKPAPPALKWERVSPLPTDADLYALASARGLTMAAGEGGTILTSTDGHNWTLRDTGTTDDLFGVAAAPSGWVAVGDGVILTSPDGAAWTPRTGAANRDLRAAACGPQTCVAVGDKGAAVTGKLTGKWNPVEMGTTNDLLSIAYANGKFVAMGAKGAAFSSGDGRAWAPLELKLPETPQGFYNDLTNVMFTQDMWVIGVAGWGSFILTSRDGATWELREAGEGWGRLWAAGGEKLLRLAFREKQPSRSFTSTDLGATWQQQTINLGAWPHMRALVWDGTQFLVAGDSGIIKASKDGVTWEGRLPQGNWQGWSDIAFGEGRFVALGSGDIAVSNDGLKWDLQPRAKPQPLYLDSIVRGPDRFVATGLGVYTSVDGVTWAPQQAPTDWPIKSVVWGNGRYVAVRGNETLTSVDGAVWQLGTALGPERYFENLVASESGFVAYSQTIGGAHNEVYTSADGLTWTSQGLQPFFWSMTYGKGLYVAFTVSGMVMTSPDGREWTESKPPVHEGVKVFFTGDRFVGMGSESVLLSTDGRTWKVDGRQPARHGIIGMAFGNGRLVGVGGVGSIIAATPSK